jgi:hypothetical protein
MNYYLTQEQYEHLKDMGLGFDEVEITEEYATLINQIGNQPVSALTCEPPKDN